MYIPIQVWPGLQIFVKTIIPINKVLKTCVKGKKRSYKDYMLKTFDNFYFFDNN